jgi:hypothetical protein
MKKPPGKLLAGSALILLTGCASIGPPVPPMLELPKPPTDLRAVRKGDRVTLTWTIPSRTTGRQSVRYLGKTLICRSLDAALKECGAPVGEAGPSADFGNTKDAAGKKLTASFTDVLSRELELRNSFGSATYAIEVLNRDGRGAGLSNEVRVPLAPTLAPPSDFNARVTAQGVVLTWKDIPLSLRAFDPVSRGYYVYRRAEGSQQNVLVGEREAGSGGNVSLTDQSFEWEKTYYYHLDTFTTIAEPGKAKASVDGDSTPEVKVFTHDVFPPAVPSALQAVFSGPGQAPFIDLIWSPVSDADLDGYNVYRHEAGEPPVRLNAELVKTPAFRDTAVVAGKKYFYSVSAVDERGNESARSEEAEENVP